MIVYISYILGGLLVIAIGGFCTWKYLKLVEEGTGYNVMKPVAGVKLKTKQRLNTVARKPKYTQIRIFSLLQILCYGIGTLLVLYGIFDWANNLSQW